MRGLSNSDFSINRESSSNPLNVYPPKIVQTGPATRGWRSDTGAGLLSIAHISPQTIEEPFIEFVPGASYFKVSRGGQKLDQVGGGRRGQISGFSRGSRRRLMVLMSKIPESAKLPLFVTLTYPERFPSPLESKKHLENLIKRLKRAFPDVGLIWKLEPQERGAPHYHMLVWGIELQKLSIWMPTNWYQVAGYGDILHYRWHSGLLGRGNLHCVQAVRSHKGVIAYASKYLGKPFEISGWKNSGRYWAVVQPKNIPFGSPYKIEVQISKAIAAMRYQRSFLRSKERIARAKALAHGAERKQRKRKNFNPRSQITFCDASRWVINILKE